jgi:hypothetical protein
MRKVLSIIALLFFGGCSIKQFYPTAGAMIGGGAGALTGNPVIVGLTAGSGALLGEMAKGNAELEEAQETITALSQGDVEALLAPGIGENQTLFETFVSRIRNILLIAGVCLIAYLAIPIFVAKKCSKAEAVKHSTRPPFPLPRDK